MSVSSIQPGTGPRALTEPIVVASDAATSIFNLPDYRVISATVLDDGRRRVIVETDQPPGCPSCGVVATRRKERRFQRIRDIPVGGAVEVLWSKYRWHCEERACPRLSFYESTAQVPRRARSTARLRDQVVDAVISSGRAVSETAAAFAVSWWMVRAALTEASFLTLPEVDELSPRMLGIDEHRFRSVRFFRDPESSSWIRHEPWMTTIVDQDTGQVLGIVDGRDHKGVGDWLFARPLEWRLGVQVVAIDPSAACSVLPSSLNTEGASAAMGSARREAPWRYYLEFSSGRGRWVPHSGAKALLY